MKVKFFLLREVRTVKKLRAKINSFLAPRSFTSWLYKKGVTPNFLTGSRFFFSLLVALPLWLEVRTLPYLFLMFSAYAVGCYTDLLDGVVARRYGAETELGKYIDPLADKSCYLPVLVYAGLRTSFIPQWLFYFLVSESVILLLLGSGKAVLRDRIAVEAGANWFGKLKYGFQTVFFMPMIFSRSPLMLQAGVIVSLLAALSICGHAWDYFRTLK